MSAKDYSPYDVANRPMARSWWPRSRASSFGAAASVSAVLVTACRATIHHDARAGTALLATATQRPAMGRDHAALRGLSSARQDASWVRRGRDGLARPRPADDVGFSRLGQPDAGRGVERVVAPYANPEGVGHYQSKARYINAGR